MPLDACSGQSGWVGKSNGTESRVENDELLGSNMSKLLRKDPAEITRSECLAAFLFFKS